MRPGAASSTAELIPRALALLGADGRTRHLVPAEAERLSVAFLASRPSGAAFLRRIRRPGARRLALAVERATIPGLFLHFALRKQAIERHVRAALDAGARQVVVVGAGLDALAARLCRDAPAVTFFELDHGASQAAKRKALEAARALAPNLHLLPLDLVSTTPDTVLLRCPHYDAQAPTVAVVEGVLMYLDLSVAERTLLGLRQALGPGSRLVATVLARQGGGRAGRAGRADRVAFAGQTWLADLWLRWRGEPFRWATHAAALGAMLESCGFRLAAPPVDAADADAALPPGLAASRGELVAVADVDAGVWLADVQTRLQPIRVAEVLRPRSTAEVQAAVLRAARAGRCVSVAGGRHSQGGQQFGHDALHLDLTGLDRILSLDRAAGIVHAEAGIQWPALVAGLAAMQGGEPRPWGIVQKQTGADDLSLGGALASNIHGRGLAFRPIIQDVEAFLLVDAQGRPRRCSRREDRELFALAVGGYGLFGVITEVWLRLQRRMTLERVVEMAPVDGLAERMEARARAGFLYGDLQYDIDPASPGFLAQGVFSCYRPVDRPPVEGRVRLTVEDWEALARGAHTDRGEAFGRYCSHYLATSGQLYDSDRHQLTTYAYDYHQRMDEALGRPAGCEVISELYVPRPALSAFVEAARRSLLDGGEPIYGTIRLVERDEESFLAWARQPWACLIVNLHVERTAPAVEHAKRHVRRLYDLALLHGGSFYLTYHAWATREQVERGHPRFREFLAAKRRHDPEGRFRSAWYDAMLDLFGMAA